jgi:hypothetical protein
MSVDEPINRSSPVIAPLLPPPAYDFAPAGVIVADIPETMEVQYA